MTPLRIGYCGICDIVPIFDQVKGRLVANQNYAEIVIVMSDETVARHGVCVACAASLNQQKVDGVFGRIKETWQQEMVGAATRKQFEKVRSLKVETYGHDRHETLKRFKEKKEKAHREKIAKNKN